MTKRAVSTDKIAPPVGPFSAGIIGTPALYLSGQIGLDPRTATLVVGDVTDQTDQVLQNVQAVLDAAGRTLSNVIKINVYLADMRDFAAMNAAYERHFEAPYPARTTIQAAGLPLGALVEMEIIAE